MNSTTPRPLPLWFRRAGVALSLLLALFYSFWVLPQIAANPQQRGPLDNPVFALFYVQFWLVTWTYAMRAAGAFYGLKTPRLVLRFDINRSPPRGWTVVLLMFLSYALTVYGFGLAYIYLSSFDPRAFNNPLGIIDGIYFSVVTAATVGYGDILPISPWARTITMLEIAVSLLYAVLLFSVASSYARDLREARPTGSDERSSNGRV